MSIFNYTEEQMAAASSTFTIHEIYQQPATWRKTCAQLAACKEELQKFLDQVVKAEDFDIVLTGAGTSEFVGNSLYHALNKKYNFKVKSYASTDIVPNPEDTLSRTKPTLLVNFGRSGNSPESVGSVEAAEVVCENLYHLFVTCNCEGALSKLADSRDNCFALNLTPETHDKSFAMTSSYSNMYLATYLALNLDRLEEITAAVEKICVAGENFLKVHSEILLFSFFTGRCANYLNSFSISSVPSVGTRRISRSTPSSRSLANAATSLSSTATEPATWRLPSAMCMLPMLTFLIGTPPSTRRSTSVGVSQTMKIFCLSFAL